MVSGQPPQHEPAPRRHRSRRAPLLVLALLVVGLVAADQVRAAQARDAAAVRLVLVAAAAAPAGALPTAVSVSTDAVVALTVRNEGPGRVRVLEQRLDGGGPTDPGPSLAAGASAALSVRWRVLCGETGSLYGPQSLDLVVRTRLRAVRPVRLGLGPPSGPVRRAFRTSAVDRCEGLTR